MQLSTFLGVFLASSGAGASAFVPPAPYAAARTSLHRHQSMVSDDIPSDYSSDDLTPPGHPSVSVDEDEDDVVIRDQLKRELLLLASTTDRGEFATLDERDIIVDLITQLEALNPTADPALSCSGEWDLCLTSTQLFRSSPFFQSLRSLAGDSNKAIAENGFDLHDKATSNGQIGRVRQDVTDDGATLVSEVDLEVGFLPGIPFRVKGTVVTRAELKMVPPETWEVRVVGTAVKGSNVPFLDQLLDDIDLELPVGSLYESLLGSVPVSTLKTFYVDEGIRITRDVDDNIYVFSRA